MKIHSRIRTHFQSLLGLIEASNTRSKEFLFGLRTWARALADVAPVARGAMELNGVFGPLLTGPVEDLPIARSALDRFVENVRSYETGSDPAKYAEEMGWIFQPLTVYELETECCDECQGDLELWLDAAGAYWQCDFLGCMYSLDMTPSTDRPGGGRAALRCEVSTHLPDADLVEFE